MFDEIKIESMDNNLKGYIKIENSEYYPDIGIPKKHELSEKKNTINSLAKN